MTIKCFDIPSSGFQFQNLYPPAKKKLWGEAFHNFKNGFSHNCGGNRHHLFDCLSDLSVEKIAIEGIFIIIGNAVSAMTSVSLHCPENLSTCATSVNRSVKTLNLFLESIDALFSIRRILGLNLAHFLPLGTLINGPDHSSSSSFQKGRKVETASHCEYKLPF